MLLRIGETVRSAEFARFVDVDRELARHLLSAYLKTRDFRAAPRLALPCRGDVPFRLAFCRFSFDPLDQRKQVIDIDAVDDGGFGGSFCTPMMCFLCGFWISDLESNAVLRVPVR
jgi:hypothetical protein